MSESADHQQTGHQDDCRHDSGQPCSCCGSCVAPVLSRQERLTALQTVLAGESEPLVALTHLLRLCRDEHRQLWEWVGDADCQRQVAALLEPLRAQPTAAQLTPQVCRLLANALDPVEQVPTVVVAHALAGFIDDHYGDTFADSFRRRSPYQPSVGDPIPLGAPDLRTVTAMRPTSPPWRLANRLDETRRLRLAGEWAIQFQVVFDYSLFDTLTGLVGPDTVIATCHPNRSLGEFTLTNSGDERRFPVQPADSDRQRAAINCLLDEAALARASIVVLPELCMTEPLALELRERVHRPDGPRILVAGSYHHQDSHELDGHSARRRNRAVCWIRDHDRPLVHDKHSPGDRPIAEDIQPLGWPQLRIYVTRDGWHLAIAICRDLLNPQAVNALAEAGANLILVPAMSETLVPFGGPVAHLVGSRQAIVVVANNPATWGAGPGPGGARPARALFGHPGFGQQTRFVHAPDSGPGLALLTVGAAQLTWKAAVPTDVADPRPSPGSRAVARPEWLVPLAGTIADVPQVDGQPVQLRPAAVLVLLSESATGPQVLLTQRAADLTDYPAQLSFPGGRTEAHDDGPVATALREAAEEVGLDTDTVEVIRLLPPFALPDSGYLVTPVLAWSPNPIDTNALNLAEVTAAYHVPLANLRNRYRAVPATRPFEAGPDLTALGTMTATVVDLLVGILAHAEIRP